MRRIFRLAILVLLAAAGGAAYYFYAKPPSSLVLTGIVSVQTGAGVAKSLFESLPPSAVVWLRLLTSAVLLVLDSPADLWPVTWDLLRIGYPPPVGWLAGAGTDAVSVNGSLLVNLVSARERLVPYAAVGGGSYRTSFDLADPAFFGPNQHQFGPGSLVCPAPGTGIGPGPGSGFGAGTGTCPGTAAGYWGVGQMPDFYARRLGPMAVPSGGAWDTHSFTDPAVSIGGGLRFNVHEHLMVRPDVRALVVFADGETHTLAVFGVQLGYRF